MKWTSCEQRWRRSGTVIWRRRCTSSRIYAGNWTAPTRTVGSFSTACARLNRRVCVLHRPDTSTESFYVEWSRTWRCFCHREWKHFECDKKLVLISDLCKISIELSNLCCTDENRIIKPVSLPTGGQRCICASAQWTRDGGRQAYTGGRWKRAAQAKDHRGGDLQTGHAERARESQRGMILQLTGFESILDSSALLLNWIMKDKKYFIRGDSLKAYLCSSVAIVQLFIHECCSLSSTESGYNCYRDILSYLQLNLCVQPFSFCVLLHKM